MGSTQIKNVLSKANNIEVIVSSLDGVKRAEAPPFLFGKIMAKLNSPKDSIVEKLNNLISRPAIVISFLSLVLFMDGMVFQSILKSMPVKYENGTEDIFTSGYFEEMLFYDTSNSEYASI